MVTTASGNFQPMKTSLYRVPSGVCHSTDQDGTIVLNIEQGKFYSLISAGSMVWQQVAAHPEGATFDTVVDKLMTNEVEFANKPREKVERAISSMLNTLVESGLIETSERPSSRAFGSIRCLACAAIVVLVRGITNLLIRRQMQRSAAFVELVMFQVIRWVGRFPARYHTIKNWPVEPRPMVESEDIERICSAVDEAATWYPKESLCLQRSSVTACLLRQHGVPAEMKIGIHKLPFASHAWVEVAGKVINDHKGVQTYFKVIDVW
jgi:hypothetical protein